MSDRADFKNSIRNLAQVLRDEPSPSSTQPVTNGHTVAAANVSKKRPVRSFAKQQANLAKVALAEESNFKMVSSLYPKYIEDLLTKASHMQRAKGLFPGKKQDIRIEAAKEWLVRNGYLGGDDDQESPSS